jgi:CheY-like chemotaxis protein
MDIQMPLLDGFQATERIRLREQKSTDMSSPSDSPSRTPIIAISASLEESRRGEYMKRGMDAWMLKPVNFRRLEMLLRGIHEADTRASLLYTPGTWELGGWLTDTERFSGV